jgi:hypothetical protein
MLFLCCKEVNPVLEIVENPPRRLLRIPMKNMCPQLDTDDTLRPNRLHYDDCVYDMIHLQQLSFEGSRHDCIPIQSL